MLEEIDLVELGFSFAVEDLDPTLGRIEAYQVDWAGSTGIKTKKRIDLVPCQSIPFHDIPINNNFTRARDRSGQPERETDEVRRFLCPSPDARLIIQGGYFDENFKYFELRVKVCEEDLLPDNQVCSQKPIFA